MRHRGNEMRQGHVPHDTTEGFTLIELSIVLVIIGLIVGGVLVGQDLIHAAAIRRQVSQFEKYNTAVNSFRLKYNVLPGDMLPEQASALGFFGRSGGGGDGDGDGYITGLGGYFYLGGETVLFWEDLSAAGLIDGSFKYNPDVNMTTDAQFAAEMPRAKIGNGNFVYVNGVYNGFIPPVTSGDNTLYMNGFQIIRTDSMNGFGMLNTTSGLTPVESYNMDQKIDDGLPLSGKVIAMYGDYDGIQLSPGWEIDYGWLTSKCVLPGPPVTYNVGTPAVSNTYQCSLRFNAGW